MLTVQALGGCLALSDDLSPEREKMIKLEDRVETATATSWIFTDDRPNAVPYIVGEAKWTTRPLDVRVLRDLAEYQRPALEQAGFPLDPSCRTVLYCRAGYTDGLRRRAEEDPRLHLVNVEDIVAPPADRTTDDEHASPT